MNERRIPRDELEDLIWVIPPDRVCELHCVDKPGPARSLVASREHELRIGQLRGRGVGHLRMLCTEFRDRVRIAVVDGAEELLGLTVKLCEVGPDGQAADGHTSLLQ
jgi:hypothetical protein